MSAVTTTNESQLYPLPAPTMSPTAPANSDQTLVSVPPVLNETKSETTGGSPPASQQLESKKPVTPTEKNNNDNNDEPIGNKVSTVKASTKQDETDENRQDKINKLNRPDVASEPNEQPSLTQPITNKTLVDQEDGMPDSHDKPIAPNIRMCTVRLEILMEVDIVKHVHVHKETESKTASPITASEPVETVETLHFTRSHAKTKSPRTNR